MATFNPSYPIGVYNPPKNIDTSLIEEWIQDIASFPERIETLTKDLDSTELSKSYREGGWTIKQIVHHCADSHINSYIRFRKALTEDTPVISPYDQDLWSEIEDANEDNLSYSLMIIEGIHYRWVHLLRGLDSSQLQRTFIHPEHNETFTVEYNIGSYAWHCNQHLAHIQISLGIWKN